MTKVNVIFHSLYGHVYTMAMAEAEGARSVDGANVGIYRIPETLPPEVLKKMRADQTVERFAEIPVATMDDLREADALIFGTPTRFGNMSAQMRAFMDRTGRLWAENALVGKIGSVFTSSATQHGGQESTILSFHTTLLHHGMLLVGLPYTEIRQKTTEEVSGGSPYGATTIAGDNGTRVPSENELEMARYQGRHVAMLARRMGRGVPIRVSAGMKPAP